MAAVANALFARRRQQSGSDFLPLVVKLDDLFNHLAQVREMLSRLVDLHHAIASRRAAGSEVQPEKVDQWLAGQDQTQVTQALTPAAAAGNTTAHTTAMDAEGTGAVGLERTLEDLAARVASSQSKQVSLRCTGLDAVPEAYRRAVKDITIQLVRNAVVHGIEEPSERAKSNLRARAERYGFPEEDLAAMPAVLDAWSAAVATRLAPVLSTIAAVLTVSPIPAAPAEFRRHEHIYAKSNDNAQRRQHKAQCSMTHDDLDHGSACYLALTGQFHPRKSSNPPPRER